VVTYFASEKPANAKGAINLRQAIHITRPGTDQAKAGCDFEVIIPGRTYRLRCATPKDVDVWIDLFSHAKDR